MTKSKHDWLWDKYAHIPTKPEKKNPSCLVPFAMFAAACVLIGMACWLLVNAPT